MIEFITKYIIEIILGCILTLITYLYNKLRNYNRVIKYTKNGVKILLKNKIIEKYYYYMKQGFITLYDKQMIEDLYNEYHNLNGNGLIENLIEDINDLPISNDNNIKKTILLE